jgi:Transcriptional regulator, AbiEi antitoxin
MGYQKHRLSRRARLWSLAEGQHGVVTRAQMVELGFHPQAIKHRIARGRLHPLWRGVYAVGRPQVTRHGRWLAAVLSCGPDAVLSHGSAAALWEIGAERSGWIEVSVPKRSPHGRAGVVVHRRAALTVQDVTSHEGIPVTTAVCTLVDLGPRLGSRRLERAIKAPHVRAHRLRARASLPAARAQSRAPHARDRPPPQRVQGRLLLAGPRARRRDRRLALPPDAHRAGP